MRRSARKSSRVVGRIALRKFSLTPPRRYVLCLFMFVSVPIPRTVADRFALVIDGLRRAVAARGAGRNVGGGLLAGPLVVLIWDRLCRMAARFSAIAARVRSGALPS